MNNPQDDSERNSEKHNVVDDVEDDRDKTSHAENDKPGPVMRLSLMMLLERGRPKRKQPKQRHQRRRDTRERGLTDDECRYDHRHDDHSGDYSDNNDSNEHRNRDTRSTTSTQQPTMLPYQNHHNDDEYDGYHDDYDDYTYDDAYTDQGTDCALQLSPAYNCHFVDDDYDDESDDDYLNHHNNHGNKDDEDNDTSSLRPSRRRPRSLYHRPFHIPGINGESRWLRLYYEAANQSVPPNRRDSVLVPKVMPSVHRTSMTSRSSQDQSQTKTSTDKSTMDAKKLALHNQTNDGKGGTGEDSDEDDCCDDDQRTQSTHMESGTESPAMSMMDRQSLTSPSRKTDEATMNRHLVQQQDMNSNSHFNNSHNHVQILLESASPALPAVPLPFYGNDDEDNESRNDHNDNDTLDNTLGDDTICTRRSLLRNLQPGKSMHMLLAYDDNDDLIQPSPPQPMTSVSIPSSHVNVIATSITTGRRKSETYALDSPSAVETALKPCRSSMPSLENVGRGDGQDPSQSHHQRNKSSGHNRPLTDFLSDSIRSLSERVLKSFDDEIVSLQTELAQKEDILVLPNSVVANYEDDGEEEDEDLLPEMLPETLQEDTEPTKAPIDMVVDMEEKENAKMSRRRSSISTTTSSSRRRS